MALGSSISVSSAETGNRVSSYRRTPGNLGDNSGWIPGSISIGPPRSYSVYQSIFSLVRFLNSKLAPYYVFFDLPPHLLNVFMNFYGMGYSFRMRHFIRDYISSCTSHYLPTTNLHCFFQSKLVLTMIALGESLSKIPFLTEKTFSHRTEKYTMVVMRRLWRYLKCLVAMINLVLSLTVRMVLSISSTQFCPQE